MIETIQFMANIGEFDRVDDAATLRFGRLTLIYAENGRGKTTLAEILRSLATGDSQPLTARQRLGATSTPHVVLNMTDIADQAVFQDGDWNVPPQDHVKVFNDFFTSSNVCSGLDVHSAHRKNLHQLILGGRGVDLNNEIASLQEQIKQRREAGRQHRSAIRDAVAFRLRDDEIDEFIGLPQNPEVDVELTAQRQRRSATEEVATVRDTSLLAHIDVPDLEIDSLAGMLRTTLRDLTTTAVELVAAQIAQLSPGGEQWIHQGFRALDASASHRTCPFCGQSLDGLELIHHYEQYFSDAYRDLRDRLAQNLEEFDATHGLEARSAVANTFDRNAELVRFWSRFGDFTWPDVDRALVADDWANTADVLIERLRSKRDAPLEPIGLDAVVRQSAAKHERNRRNLIAVNSAIEQANLTIREIKEQAAKSDLQTIDDEIAKLERVKARHMPEIVAHCAAHQAELTAIQALEVKREAAKAQLEEHRRTIFSEYQDGINSYLEQFGAAFRIKRLRSRDISSGTTSAYDIDFSGQPVPVAADNVDPEKHSFGNTLSAGDRSTLAFAFFLEDLRHQASPNLVVAVDDPISSLDEHRRIETVVALRNVAQQAGQLIVLSHDKQFLASIWEQIKPPGSGDRVTLRIARQAEGSSLKAWDVSDAVVTLHDKRHALITEYVETGNGDEQAVAEALRPYLEGYLRVAFPKECPPGFLLGQFIKECKDRLSAGDPILSHTDIAELDTLRAYTNPFHHYEGPTHTPADTNPNTVTTFARRTLKFCKRKPQSEAG